MRVFGLETLGIHGGMDILDRSLFSALGARPELEVVWVTCDENISSDPHYETWTPFRQIYGADPMWRRALRYARGFWQLVRRAVVEARRGPVLVHQQFVTFPLLELACMRLAQRNGVAWVLTPHETAMHHDPSRTGRLLGRMYTGADALIALSEANREDLEQAVAGAPQTVHLVHLGHLNDFRGATPWLSQSVARDKLGLPQDARIILFQGEIRPVKGLEYLLRAMPDILRYIPQAVLVVAGRPHGMDFVPLRRLMTELGIEAATRLELRFMPDSELSLYFRAADAVALPYLAASQSAACFTAYAYRRPVVVSGVGGLIGQVQDGLTGHLVPPRESALLAQALIKLLLDPARAEAMGDRAREWVAQTRSWTNIAAQTAQVYRTALARRAEALGRSAPGVTNPVP
jgi:glycosyltransferase involved in cell wall biosynthesis